MSSFTGSLPDLLQRTHEVRGDQVVYRFANGMTIVTEVFNKPDPRRILPLGTPQGSLMNHLLNFPQRARGKLVFEPFAGSGPLGLTALMVGARHADFLDINPRAAVFQRNNAGLNRIPVDRFAAVQGDVATFVPERRYDLLLANPPFVPTPNGIDGTLTSNGGPEGSRFVEILLDRLEEFLEPSGEALIYVFQLAVDGRPLILERLQPVSSRRPVELTASQEHHVPLDAYVSAYQKLFPAGHAAIDRWRSGLVRRHGGGVTLCHYVVEVGACLPTASKCTIREDFAQRFGRSFLVPSEKAEELAFSRVFENFVPPPPEPDR